MSGIRQINDEEVRRLLAVFEEIVAKGVPLLDDVPIKSLRAWAKYNRADLVVFAERHVRKTAFWEQVRLAFGKRRGEAASRRDRMRDIVGPSYDEPLGEGI